MTREQAKPVIESVLSQISNPLERIELLKEMIPGTVKNFETFQLAKARVAERFTSKQKFQPQKKNRTNGSSS